jgi:hypothetical protein
MPLCAVFSSRHAILQLFCNLLISVLETIENSLLFLDFQLELSSYQLTTPNLVLQLALSSVVEN